jgi:hypothetical protein
MERQARRKHLDSTAPQARGAVGAQLRIHQERAVELEVFAKGGRKICGAVANDDEVGSPRSNLVDLVAQLRDLLTTEQSSEVADEDEDNWLLLPVLRQRSGFPRPIGKLDPRQPARDSHDGSLSSLLGFGH